MPSRRNDNKPSHPNVGKGYPQTGTGHQPPSKLKNKVDVVAHEEGSFPTKYVSSLPPLPDDDYPIGIIVQNAADSLVYRNVNNEWVLIGEAGELRPNIEVELTQEGTTGIMELIITDSHDEVKSVEFKKTDGGGAFGAWVEDTSLPYKETVSIDKKHNNSIAFRVTWGDDNNVITGSHTFDVDTIAEVKRLNLSIDSVDGSILADIAGDEDTAKHYITAKVGSPPQDPDGQGNEVAELLDRDGLIDLDVALKVDETGYVKVRPENTSGVLSAVQYIAQARITRDSAGAGGGPLAAVPGVTVDEDTRAFDRLTLTASPGPLGGGSGELRYRIDGGAETAWLDSPESITVQADPIKTRTVEVQARDTQNPAKSKSGWITYTVDPVIKGLGDGGRVDPAQPMEPVETEGERSRELPEGRRSAAVQSDRAASSAIREGTGEALEQSGYVPKIGSGRFAGDVMDAEGIGKLLDAQNKKVTPNLSAPGGKGMDAVESDSTKGKEADDDLTANQNIDRAGNKVKYGSGSAMDDKEPAEAGAEQTAGKDLGVLAGRTADKIDREAGGATLRNIVRFMADGGELTTDSRQVTSDEPRQLARGILAGRAADGDSVDFTEAVPGGFSQVPVVLIFGGPSYLPGDGSGNFGSGTRQWPVKVADQLDELGFVMRAVMQDRGTTTQNTETFPSGTITSDGGTHQHDGLDDDAVDDEFTVAFSGSVSATAGVGQFETYTHEVKVIVESDSGNGVWETRGSFSYFATAADGNSSTNNFSGDITFTDADLGKFDNVRIRCEESGSGNGFGSFSVDPDTVQYNVASVVESTLSPNGEKLSWIAFEGL